MYNKENSKRKQNANSLSLFHEPLEEWTFPKFEYNPIEDAYDELGYVSTSFQLPRSYFISPENFDWNFRVLYIKNWKNILKKWEAIISS
jgi:hypothetical protein